jgi:hypothetical protein
MRLLNPPAAFHLAMVKHFRTDDRYWRYVEDLQIGPWNGCARARTGFG